MTSHTAPTLLSICRVLGSPNSACFRAEGLAGTVVSSPATGASLYHTARSHKLAVLSVRSLEHSKRSFSCTEEIWSGDWVAAQLDCSREWSPGPLQFRKLFWPSRVACSQILVFLTPSNLVPKHSFSSVVFLDPPAHPASGRMGSESQLQS